MEDKKNCSLNLEQRKTILEQFKNHSFSWILSFLFGESFTLEQTLAVYRFMNRNKCFDYISNQDFRNEVLNLKKTGMKDDEVYRQIKNKYKNIGLYQVSSVITAESTTRRVGRWTNEDQRVLRFLYDAHSKQAFQRVLYPRLLANIQKQASRLQLSFEDSFDHVGVKTKDRIKVGELREILKEYNDDDDFLIYAYGFPELVEVVKVGHKIGQKREHQNPMITIWTER